MFKHHNLTLKKGFEVKSGGTKLSKLMYIMILYWLLHITKKEPPCNTTVDPCNRGERSNQTLPKGLYIMVSSRLIIYRKLQKQKK